MTSITHITTVVVPVADQETALAFYVEGLGFEKVADFTYETGERWLEVAPQGSTIGLTLAQARPERPVGIETGIALASRDVRGDLEAVRAAGVPTDPELLPQASSLGGRAPRSPGGPTSSGSSTLTATRY
jgi:catechol 2,3-dioxygenase-like lactoylglutathione lyase family enzyme